MPKLILTFDTKTGELLDYVNEDKRTVEITGGANGYVRGESNELHIAGWQLFITLGQTPDEKARQVFVNTALKWRFTQEEALRKALDDEGVSKLDIGLRSRLEGAVEMIDLLLKEIGYVPPQVDVTGKEPNDGAAQPEGDSG